jgi:hypothetical protein
MRWLCVMVVLVACQAVPKKPWRPAPPMAVEDVATWFLKAALSGDESTARTLTVRSDQIVQLSNRADAAEWDKIVDDTLAQLAREGNGEALDVRARVVKRETLTPKDNEKVLREFEIAIVELSVGPGEGQPWLFIRTDEGWRFSPKQ